MMAVAVSAASGAALCTAKGLGVTIVPAADRQPTHGRVVATVAVELMAPADELRARFASTGALEHVTPDVELSGQWSAGETVTLTLQALTRGVGPGEVAVQVEAVGRPGGVTVGRRAVLHAEVAGEHVWLSGSSPTDLRVRRLAADRGLSGAARAASLAAVTTTTVAPDHAPRPPRVKSAADLELEATLGRTAGPAGVPQAAMGAASAAGVASIVVQGRAEWKDRVGRLHPIPLATVEILEDDGLLGASVVATTTTDAAGDYSAPILIDDGPGEGDPDLLVHVLARSTVADIRPDAPGASTWALASPLSSEVATGTTLTINLTAGNQSDGETVFSLHHALVLIGAYAGTLAGVTPSQVDTRFPTTQSTSLFNGTQLHLLQLDRWDWDIVHHEYGHYFSAIHGIQNNPGGAHTFGTNLAAQGGKSNGVRQAWGEGWPTFFGVAGQQRRGAAGLRIPHVGDTHYTDTEDSSIDFDLEHAVGVGEDDELSVLATLWDVFDAPVDGPDTVVRGDRDMFATCKSTGATKLGDFWEAIAAGEDNQGKVTLGGVFGAHKVAPELLEPDDNATLLASDPPAEFKWEKNGGGSVTPLDDFSITFYSADYSTELLTKDLGDTDSFTPTSAEWAQIFAQGQPIQWVVEGKSTAGPATPGGAIGHYWSGSRAIGGTPFVLVVDETGSMDEELAGIIAALQDFIDEVEAGLPPGASPPTIKLITFKDTVTDLLTTDDLALLRSAVAGLVATGGGDCPEASAAALQLASDTVAPGGTVVLATDASPRPGVDLESLIATMREAGVTVNTILSGDCSPDAAARPGSLMAAGPQGGDLELHTLVRKPGPGAVDPPQPPVVDAGQPPVDDHANTPHGATRLVVNAPPTAGSIGLPGDETDVFVVTLPAGKTTTLRTTLLAAYQWVAVDYLDSDGSTWIGSGMVSQAGASALWLQPVPDGSTQDVYLVVARPPGASATPFTVQVSDDPLLACDSAVKVFSILAAETGGVLLVRDGVNFGQAHEYKVAVFNLLMSAIAPRVLAADPDDVPQGTTLAVALQGRKTSWRPGARVELSGPGLRVASVTVHSPTSLTALVEVAPDAPLGYRDVAVHSDLGGVVETAVGTGVVEVTGPVTGPTLLTIEPATLTQGTTTRVTVRGASTSWDASSQLDLGPGVGVSNLVVSSPTVLAADATVAGGAEIGFRLASVATGAGGEVNDRAVFVAAGATGVPKVSSVTPGSGAPGQTLDLAVTGVKTGFSGGLTSASLGSGVTVLSVVVHDPTHATVKVRVEPGASPGFRDVHLATGGEVAVGLGAFFVAGVGAADVNGDGSTNVADVFYLINFLFAGGAPPVGAADVNGDSSVTVADVFYLINYLFAGGAPPV